MPVNFNFKGAALVLAAQVAFADGEKRIVSKW
jgi:hypothetical protein